MISRKITVLITFLVLAFALSFCKKSSLAPSTPVKYDTTRYVLDLGAFPAPVFTDNVPTVTGVQLGKMLFHEKLLSKDGSQACASCHLQSHGFSDSLKYSIGVKGLPGKRQAMSVFNTAWHTNEFFWDGRAHLLRHQSLMPIQDTLEMNETLANVVSKLSGSQKYKDQFYRAFGSNEINTDKIALALEQFMNSIVSNKSKYDKYLAGQESLTESEERGRRLFFLEYNQFFPDQSGADCAHCHGGFNFANNSYRNNGLDLESEMKDAGRKNVTMNNADLGKFKVPSLRNIAVTAPYMHDGRFKTLEEVLDHYNTGIKDAPSLDPALQASMGIGLRLTTQNKADIIAFLNTLTDNTLATDSRYSN